MDSKSDLLGTRDNHSKKPASREERGQRLNFFYNPKMIPIKAKTSSSVLLDGKGNRRMEVLRKQRKKSKWQATQVEAAFVSQGLQGIRTSEFQIGVLQNKVFAGTQNGCSQDTVVIFDTSKWKVEGETTICGLKHCFRLHFVHENS